MATDNPNATQKPANNRAGDGFVMMAMAVVTLALCLGLVVQVGLSLWMAVTISLATYLTMLMVHRIARRHDQLDELKSEIEFLRGELARLSQNGDPVGAMRARGPAPSSSPASSAAVPTSKPAPAAAVAEGAVPPAATSARMSPPAAPAATSAPQVPQVVRAPQSPNVTAAPLPMTSAPVATVHRGVDETPFSTGPAPLRPSVDELPFAKSPPANSAPTKVAPPSPPLGNGSRDPLLPMPPLDGESQQDKSLRAGDAPGLAAASPREADVEMINGLIRKLAAEVNAAEIEKLSAAPSPRMGVGSTMLEKSIGALRETAATMKAPVTSAKGNASSAAIGRPAENERGARSESRDLPHPPSLSPPISPRRQTIIAHSAAEPPRTEPVLPEPAQTRPQEEPEFDYEALMRRAETIATMTSMPPPLPSAPNANAKASAGDTDREFFDVDTARELEALKDGLERAGAVAPAAADVGDAAFRITASGADDPLQETVPWLEQSATAAELSAEPASEGPLGENKLDPRLLAISEAIEQGRVDVFLEPILELEGQQARHFEVSLTLRNADGTPFETQDDVDVDTPSRAIPLQDSLRLKRTAQVARLLDERGKSGAVFSSFSGEALESAEFLTSFAEAFDAQPSLAGQLVLTFTQADARRFLNPHWAMLQEMRDLGFAFAIRAVTNLDMDFERLVAMGFKFVKLDATVFLGGLPAGGTVVPTSDLMKHFMDEGLIPVIESIVDEESRAKLIEYEVRFGQGLLFGGPRLMKAANAGTRSAA